MARASCATSGAGVSSGPQASDLLDLALSCGYESQAAFTRAFKSAFQQTPAAYRALAQRGDPLILDHPETLPMTQSASMNLATPRLVDAPAYRFVGVSRRYDSGDVSGIPAQWAECAAKVPVESADATYGVCYNMTADGAMDYLCAVQSSEATAGDDLTVVDVPAGRYAVFRHEGHISEMAVVWQAIFRTGLSDAGLSLKPGPEFERYGSEFDPQTGTGGYEIWIPVETE
ncbi:MAG: AraC family transcriptional regulator [Pseudomonadota bacterium]